MTAIAPPEDIWLRAGDIRLHVRKWDGKSLPFILLHGLASNSRTWDAVAEALNQAGYLVFSVDQRGHGSSDKPAHGYGFDEVTADLRELIETMHLAEPPILAGQSWGGNVVLEFAARYPKLARGLVLVDGGFLELSTRPGATWEKIAVDLRPPDLAGRQRVELAARLRAAHPGWTESGIEATLNNFETLPDGTVRPWLSLDRHMEILRALWEHRPPGLYAGIESPVLIAPASEAENSEWTRLKRIQVEKAAMAIPRCKVRWFPATDHDIHVHRPRDLAGVILEAVSDGFFS